MFLFNILYTAYIFASYNSVRGILKLMMLIVNSISRVKSPVVVLPKGVHIQTKSRFRGVFRNSAE